MSIQNFIISVPINADTVATALTKCFADESETVIVEVLRQMMEEVRRRGGDVSATVRTTRLDRKAASKAEDHIERDKRQNYRQRLPAAVVLFTRPQSALLALHR